MALLINLLGEQETLQQFDGRRFFSETNIRIINFVTAGEYDQRKIKEKKINKNECQKKRKKKRPKVRHTA